jgi:pyruvate kinase
MTRTRIVATVGPASDSAESISSLIDAGVNLFRLNFSHGEHGSHGAVIDRIRRAAGSRPVAILQDLCGPKLRTTHAVSGVHGDEVDLVLPDSVCVGDPVLLADGAMQLEVIGRNRCKVLTGGSVGARKGINLPSSRLDFPSLTEKDRRDLEFGVSKGVDFVALSFVRTAADLDAVRGCGIPIIAKFETAEAVRNMKEIVKATDAVMVARGDLGVEIPLETVPGVQKELIDLARRRAKPVITATQMLRSMVDNHLPTRAEVADVANAVLDGTDAVMLSEETAIGAHPVKVVELMSRVLREAEKRHVDFDVDARGTAADVMARIAVDAARRLEAKAILVPTRTGFSARRVARFRPEIPIIALAPDEAVRRRLSLVWGVMPLTAERYGDFLTDMEHFREAVLATGLVPQGSLIVVTAGLSTGEPAKTNFVHATRL